MRYTQTTKAVLPTIAKWYLAFNINNAVHVTKIKMVSSNGICHQVLRPESIPRAHTVEAENQLPLAVLRSTYMYCGIYEQAHTHTHKHTLNKCEKVYN